MNLKNTNDGHALYDDSTYGPTFGSGHDLMFFSTTSFNGYSGLNGSYEVPANQNAQTFLAGTYNGWTIEEFEVLQVSEGVPELWRKVDFSKDNCDKIRTKISQHKFNHAKPLGVIYPNVSLFGVPGTGKSSLLNTMISALEGGQPCAAQVVRMDSDTVTLKLSSFPLFPGAPLYLWDTMGMKEHSYEGGELDYILLGHVKPNSKLTEVITPRSECYFRDPTFAQQCHCVVLVISAQHADNATTIARLKKVRNAANRLDNIPVLVALTQIDLFEPTLESVPDCELLPKVYENTRIKQLFENIRTNFGVNLNDIYPIRNYHSELEVNPKVDVLALTFLQRVLQVCDDLFRRTTLSTDNKYPTVDNATSS
jgi:GTPase SAR1 family protein